MILTATILLLREAAAGKIGLASFALALELALQCRIAAQPRTL